MMETDFLQKSLRLLKNSRSKRKMPKALKTKRDFGTDKRPLLFELNA